MPSAQELTDCEAAGMRIRSQFPLLAKRNISYLDSAATQQRPAEVIRAVETFCADTYANVHRAIYDIAGRATELFENSREKAGQFINASCADEIVFTSGTTAAINFIARAWGDEHIRAGDEIVLTIAEHHSNLVPWQQLCQRSGAQLRFVELNRDETLSTESIVAALSERTRLVTLPLVSNVLGSTLDVHTIAGEAHCRGALVAVDAAQAVAHTPLDVQQLDADFVCFSAHKLYGPTGVGVLWGRGEILDSIPPLFGGGHMIERVERNQSTYAPVPLRFEPGTPSIEAVIGLGAALDWIRSQGGVSTFAHHEHLVLRCFSAELQRHQDVRIVGSAGRHTALLSFEVKGVHPHDLAHFLSDREICVRAGHHCAQPLMQALGVPALTRLSVSPYSTPSEAQRFGATLGEALRFFRR